ncbi:MAG: DUF3800 domain-containing protein [Candidatus Xenobia bacterium]
MSVPKLCIYVDESAGQNPDDRRFVVAVVVVASQHQDELRKRLEQLELSSRRGQSKWVHSKPAQRRAYIEGLVGISALASPLYWRTHDDCRDQDRKRAEAAVAAIRDRDSADVTRRLVTIDSVTEFGRAKVLAVFKARGIERKEVRGGRDESQVFLRLADAIAGFVRHVAEEMPYAVTVWPHVRELFKGL